MVFKIVDLPLAPIALIIMRKEKWHLLQSLLISLDLTQKLNLNKTIMEMRWQMSLSLMMMMTMKIIKAIKIAMDTIRRMIWRIWQMTIIGTRMRTNTKMKKTWTKKIWINYNQKKCKNIRTKWVCSSIKTRKSQVMQALCMTSKWTFSRKRRTNGTWKTKISDSIEEYYQICFILVNYC